MKIIKIQLCCLSYLFFFSILASAQVPDPGPEIPRVLPAKVIVTKPVEMPPLKIQFPVEKYTLPNGLTVLLAEDHTVPMVSYHTWYRVGSRDEKEGVTGAAHMLEHMMFKGAKKYSGKDFDHILHANGIVNNAFTSLDYTGFYENLPSSKLELIMDVEVDRMRNLAIRPEDLKSELQVVGEERRWRVDNNPGGLLREMMMSTLFTVHPYSWPTIGWMKDIQAYTSEKLKVFYDQFYIPNNAVLVLAGDFDSEKTKKMIEKYYGSLEKKPVLEVSQRNYPVEPENKVKKQKILKWDVASPSVLIAYKGVAAGDADSYALDLASGILGGGKSSRLYKKLVYQNQTASSVSASNMANSNPGAFMVISTMKPGKSWAEAENIVLSEIEKLKTNLVSERELEKAKNQVIMEAVEGLTTIDGKAQALAINEIIFGSYERLFTDLERYRQVSSQDIQRAVQKYLLADRRVTSVLEPK
jgi:zinc protease